MIAQVRIRRGYSSKVCYNQKDRNFCLINLTANTFPQCVQVCGDFSSSFCKSLQSRRIRTPPLDLRGFPGGGSSKEPACQCRRCKRLRFDPWVGKIPWRREWQPTPVFLSGEFHGQRNLAGYSPWGRKELDTTEQLYFTLLYFTIMIGGASGKEHTCQCRRCKRLRFDPWVRKIPWKRAWKSTPVLFSGKSRGQRSLVSSNPRD